MRVLAHSFEWVAENNILGVGVLGVLSCQFETVESKTGKFYFVCL